MSDMLTIGPHISIAKGFAIEQIVLKLEEEGHTNFIISAGGNVRTSGLKADGSKWVVAVQNPKLDQEEELYYIAYGKLPALAM